MPHSSWAEVYDRAYNQVYGNVYTRLTSLTVGQVKTELPPPASIVDFGAGTGRLSIPLTELGYSVTAVEPCPEMLVQLKGKPGGTKITTVTCSMQDFVTVAKFDIALCVFTVILYLRDEATLDASIAAAAAALCPGGLLFLDIPSRAVFQGHSISVGDLRREISVVPKNENLYSYKERITIIESGKTITRTDEFEIKYWDERLVFMALEKNGFRLKKDLSEVFLGTGSKYLLLEKAR
ncbi:MAG: SAM-dependent methyltransferase [Elusimicrobia bacterium]|nr:MAG: SAM-dependent methyltransferase [Elusimicrobiota bacterium]KAF0155717.1 MAG: SAM-dependent methyltransferase [Elusimicrobiota bacterium]